MVEKIRRGVGWVIAGITCPCHLPVTAPWVLGLLAGTGLGAYLSTHLEILAAASAVLFLGGLTLWGRPARRRLLPHRPLPL